jgi:hydroxymethylpyrimidine pyrophosphatase-like HAD family hydrolase
MGKKYVEEIEYIPSAIDWALNQNVEQLTRSLINLSSRSLLSIGSGGSTTAAAFMAMLHENNNGHLSKSCTPGHLLTIQRPLQDAGAVLISAEGKNMDILAAADHLAFLEVPSVALVLRSDSPLESNCYEKGNTAVVAFDMPWRKDGYLATNSLIATMILLGRAYKENQMHALNEIDHTWLDKRRQKLIAQGLGEYFREKRSLSILYGLVGHIGAIDIESKLAESAFGTCEATDYRQFAHGRHVRLSDALRAPCFLTFNSSKDRVLCESTLALFPEEIRVVRLDLPEDPALANIVSVIDSILITGILGNALGRDPGQPEVREFGRSIHALDIRKLLPEPRDNPIALHRKIKGNTEKLTHNQFWMKGLGKFLAQLRTARIKAIVCDFDGTVCDTDKRFDGLDQRLIPFIERMAKEGIHFGFGTGRGDSLHDDLRSKLDRNIWSKILIGYYSGSIIARLDEEKFDNPVHDNRFDILENWLKDNGILVGISGSLRKHGGQLSIRLANMGPISELVSAIKYWINETGNYGWRVYCSGHSVDVLTDTTSKLLVVEAMSRSLNLDPKTQVLRIGDSGNIEGNDFELLRQGLSLSVDKVSPFSDSCWNLLPRGVKCSAGTVFYLESLEKTTDGMRFSNDFLNHLQLMFAESMGTT